MTKAKTPEAKLLRVQLLFTRKQLKASRESRRKLVAALRKQKIMRAAWQARAIAAGGCPKPRRMKEAGR